VQVPSNESAWNYLTGLLDRCHPDESAKRRVECLRHCRQELYDKRGLRSSYLLAAMVDLLSDQLEKDGLVGDVRASALGTATQVSRYLLDSFHVIIQYSNVIMVVFFSFVTIWLQTMM